MSKGMLGTLPLSEIRGPRDAFEEKLAGEEGAEWLTAFKRFLRKENPWVHIIDCDAPPFVPEGWSLAEEEHQVPGRFTGKLTWNSAKIALHLDPDQQGGRVFGDELIKRLAGKPVLPVQILDFLLDNPHLIPEEWKGKVISFWGTMYRNSRGNPTVRGLCWNDGRWSWGEDWLDYGLDSDFPAAVLAS